MIFSGRMRKYRLYNYLPWNVLNQTHLNPSLNPIKSY